MGSGSNSGFWLCGGHPNVIHTPTQTKTTGDWMVRAGNEKRVRIFSFFFKSEQERDVGAETKEKKWSLGGNKVMSL